MTYYANIDSKNILNCIDSARMITDKYGSDKVKNIEVSEEIYRNREKYIYSDGEIVLNPNYDAEKLIEAKNNKNAENDSKASVARYNQEFSIVIQNKICVFDTSEQTQRDLLTAFAVCLTGSTYDGWVTNNGVELDLTMEDVVLISQTFKEKSNVYVKWNEYREAIDSATTVNEVEAVDIDYRN